jgi:protein import protein ZIM17
LDIGKPPRSRVESQPHYRLKFTCAPCDTPSTHNISKQGYHHGSVLVTCPSCRNRHVISDHLGIFGDRKVTIEDIMREKGQLVKKGTLGEDGDIEFWAEEPAETASSETTSPESK